MKTRKRRYFLTVNFITFLCKKQGFFTINQLIYKITGNKKSDTFISFRLPAVRGLPSYKIHTLCRKSLSEIVPYLKNKTQIKCRGGHWPSADGWVYIKEPNYKHVIARSTATKQSPGSTLPGLKYYRSMQYLVSGDCHGPLGLAMTFFSLQCKKHPEVT